MPESEVRGAVVPSAATLSELLATQERLFKSLRYAESLLVEALGVGDGESAERLKPMCQELRRALTHCEHSIRAPLFLDY